MPGRHGEAQPGHVAWQRAGKEACVLIELDARDLLLVKAIEETDTAGEVLAQEERILASRRAAPPSEDAIGDLQAGQVRPAGEDFLVRRARLLRRHLEARYSAVAPVVNSLSWRGWFSLVVALCSFILGLALNELGPERRISILSFPLLGLLAWNLMIYALLAAESISQLRRRDETTHPPGPLVRAVWRASRHIKALRYKEDDRAAERRLFQGLERFVADWWKSGRALHSARARRLLHLSAALLTLGAVGGMYLRGLAFEYLAGWESTFLDEHSLHRLLEIVLGPASALTGFPIPAPDRLAAIHWGTGAAGENAAHWIHLYAATAGIFIVLPRLVLAGTATFREIRLRSEFPIPGLGDPYIQRLLSAGRGETTIARIIPFSYEISGRAREVLRAFLGDLLGWKANVDFSASVPYGGEDAFLATLKEADSSPATLIVLFNMASSPEDETHGGLIDGLKDLSMHGGAAWRLLFILDESSYRRRMGGDSSYGFRLEERRKAWRRLTESHGIRISCMDLENAEPERWLDLVGSAWWSYSAQESSR